MEEKILNIGRRPAIDEIVKSLGQGLIGAEVGVNKGYNAAYICNIVKPKILYLIDPWSNFFDPGSGEVIGEAQYITASALLSSFPACRFIKKRSSDAIADFSDNSLDFVYIDSDHSYLAVLGEIARWYPKIRKGGILAGHDFPIVKQAVIDACKALPIAQVTNQDEDFWLIK
jgi:predicted O-methyltransferase YrrM